MRNTYWLSSKRLAALVLPLMSALTAQCGVSVQVPNTIVLPQSGGNSPIESGATHQPGDPEGLWEDGGPFKITNKPECEAKKIRVAGVRLLQNNGQLGLNLQIFNTSGQRRWIQANVRFPDIPNWQATQPFYLEANQRVAYQFVRGFEDIYSARISEIVVTGCGA